MQLHELKPKHIKKKKKRIGRGGKRGTYCGRGMKGQKSRAGAKMQPSIREFIKRYPKKRGYKFKSIAEKPVVINIGLLNKKFETNEIINPQSLIKKALIRKIKGKAPQIKILGKGNITKALIVENCQISKSAKEKIEKAGGKIKIPNS